MAEKKVAINFEKAIKLNPKLLDAYNNLGVALKNCGELLKSFNVFHELHSLDYKAVLHKLIK